jgi:hypothetical protein
MKTRFNIAFVPIQTENEKYVFDNGMRAKFPISSIENLLFDKLLNELRKSHPSGLFSVWGIGAGEKSLNANNWNKLNSNDLVIFYTGLDSIVIAKVAQKFQSENVGRQIWPDSSESDVVQYVVTVDEILQFELKVKNNFSKAFYNKISSLNTFEVFENLALADIFSEGMLSSGLFLEFMARAEDVDIASISNILDNKIDDYSATTPTVNNSGFSAAERKVIEMHAVSLAKEHFAMAGYSKIEDVGSYESFDLKVQKDNETLFVEVKGTTLNGDSIVLTRNEVDLHLKVFPNNALFLVTQITLHKGDNLKASGGVIEVISPWKIAKENLSVIAYTYRI